MDGQDGQDTWGGLHSFVMHITIIHLLACKLSYLLFPILRLI